MVMKVGDFQYSYRFWLVDNEGSEIYLNEAIQQNNYSNLIGSQSWYKEIIKKTPRAVKCYELYSIYLGMLSVAMVANHDRTLISQLTPSSPSTTTSPITTAVSVPNISASVTTAISKQKSSN